MNADLEFQQFVKLVRKKGLNRALNFAVKKEGLGIKAFDFVRRIKREFPEIL